MVYLDNHSETFVCGSAREQFAAALDGTSTAVLASASAKIFDLVGAHATDSFVFTSSGAEAIQQVHWTAFIELARKEGKCHIITSSSEDAAMLQSLKRLEELGCFIKIAPLDAEGRVDLEQLKKLIGPRTAMISMSWAQGLTGVIHPVEEIGAIAQEKGILFHVDATYTLGKVYCSFADLPMDYLTFSGDRIHSVKSSGAIFAKKGKPLAPFILARPIDASSLMALAAAASQLALSQDLMSLEVARLRDVFEEQLAASIPEVQFLYQNSLRLPNVCCALFPRVHSEALLYMLERKNVKASIGGAFSPYLYRLLTHLDNICAQTALSFSLSRYTTQSDIEKAVQCIVECYQTLRPLTEDLTL